MNTIENRRAPRLPCGGIVSVPGLTDELGDLIDISQSGCRARFACDIDFAPNVEYTIALTPLKDVFEAEIRITARPVWSKKGIAVDGVDGTQIGFDFKAITNADLLYRWINRINSPGRL
ncbi:MAG: hypothetical protein Ta2A_15700 [Treponemataceae bacterium]|nr:MAG: hypothetical protein Ta2A_15700 [Treponemataceae bacterium]